MICMQWYWLLLASLLFYLSLVAIVNGTYAIVADWWLGRRNP